MSIYHIDSVSSPIKDFHLLDEEGNVFPLYTDITSLPLGQDTGTGLTLILNHKEYKVSENLRAFHRQGEYYFVNLLSLLCLSEKEESPLFLTYDVRNGKKENHYALIYVRKYKMLSEPLSSGEHLDLVFGSLFFSGPYLPQEHGSNLSFRIQNRKYFLIRD